MATSSTDVEIDPETIEIVENTLGVDTHNHVDVPLDAAELPGPRIELAGELTASGLTAICMAFAVDYQELTHEGQAYDRFLNGLSAMDTALAADNLTRAMTSADLQAAHDNHRPIVVQSVEGAHFLEGQLDRLEVAYDRGLRHLTLLHDNDASVPLGDVFTNPVQFGGLTTFGAEVVRECNRLGILIDLSHGTDDMVNAVLGITDTPVVVSHTGLDTQLGPDARMNEIMRPRLITKTQAKIVADSGGVIGVWTHLAPTPTAYAENVRAMVEVVGVDHVCIGTDTKLTPPYRSPGGAHPNRGKVNGTNDTWPNQPMGFYYTVVQAMLAVGLSAGDIASIGGGNFLRVFGAATAGH